MIIQNDFPSEKITELQNYLWESLKHIKNHKWSDELEFLAIKTEGYSNADYHIFYRVENTIYVDCIWLDSGSSHQLGGCLLDGYKYSDFVKIMPLIGELRNCIQEEEPKND